MGLDHRPLVVRLVGLEDLRAQRVGLGRQRRLDQPRGGVGGCLEARARGCREHARRRPAEQPPCLAIRRPAAARGGQADRHVDRDARRVGERARARRAASAARPPPGPAGRPPPSRRGSRLRRRREPRPGELHRLPLGLHRRPPPAPPAAPPPVGRAPVRAPGRSAPRCGRRAPPAAAAPDRARRSPAASSCAVCRCRRRPRWRVREPRVASRSPSDSTTDGSAYGRVASA